MERSKALEAQISIHSLRMEGDSHTHDNKETLDISIHSLRMEGDLLYVYSVFTRFSFQSTPSAWRETQGRIWRNST